MRETDRETQREKGDERERKIQRERGTESKTQPERNTRAGRAGESSSLYLQGRTLY